MTETKQTAKSISEDIVNILQPDLPFEEYKAKAEGIQVLIDQAITTATQQAVSVALEKVVSETWKCRFLVKPEFDERPLVTHGDLRSIVEEIKKSSLSKKGSDVK